VQDLRHAHRHRRLAGAGVAGEAHVQARRVRARCGLQAVRQAQLVHHQQRGDVADALLHGHQADEVVVELVHHGLDLALRQHLADGPGRLGRRGGGSRGLDGGRGAWNAVQRRVHASALRMASITPL
jgi:hypothetical protein